jgi:hypothetical protein
MLERIWRWMNQTVLLLGLLSVLLLMLSLTFLLPQAPVSPTNETAFLRWLAETRTTLGTSTSWLASAGLLSIRTSWWVRAALALLGIVTVARGARLLEQWERLTTYGRAIHATILLGALLLLSGWTLQLRTGWIETDVSTWPEETLTLPDHGLGLNVPNQPSWITRDRYGLYLLREKMGLGLNITAEDEEGTPILLRTSAQGDPQEQLRLTLRPKSPDAYFALPSSRLIFRVTLLTAPPEAQIRVQIYQGTGGELLTETTIQGSGSLYTEDLQIQLDSIPLPQLRVVYNPGAPPMLAGGLCLLIGTVGIMGTDAGWIPLQMQVAAEEQEQDEDAEGPGEEKVS